MVIMCDFNGKMCRCGTRMEWKDDIVIMENNGKNNVRYFYWKCDSCEKTIDIGKSESETKVEK